MAEFLKDLDNFGQATGRIAEIETDILYVINAIALKASSDHEHTGLKVEPRCEGLDQ